LLRRQRASALEVRPRGSVAAEQAERPTHTHVRLGQHARQRERPAKQLDRRSQLPLVESQTAQVGQRLGIVGAQRDRALELRRRTQRLSLPANTEPKALCAAGESGSRSTNASSSRSAARASPDRRNSSATATLGCVLMDALA
jgi:hypothetical protein